MKIVIEEDPTLRETQVLIRCRARDPQVLGMVAALGSFGQRLTGEREGQTYLLEAGEVLYAESVDKRTFLYTKAGVYETPLRLYASSYKRSGTASSRSASPFVPSPVRILYRKVRGRPDPSKSV